MFFVLDLVRQQREHIWGDVNLILIDANFVKVQTHDGLEKPGTIFNCVILNIIQMIYVQLCNFYTIWAHVHDCAVFSFHMED